jgi:hypothetical protein
MMPETTLFDAEVELGQIEKGAVLSECKNYRYHLWRIWDRDLPCMVWVMLNPSTADAEEDDPTIRRCISFARDNGYGGISVKNLFALRATDPAELLTHSDPVGPQNLDWLCNLRGVAVATQVVVGFGCFATQRRLLPRAMSSITTVCAYGSPECFGTTKKGWPRHPLYLKADSKLTKWSIPPSK